MSSMKMFDETRELVSTPQSIVLTLDRGFTLYRKHGRQVIPTRMPGM